MLIRPATPNDAPAIAALYNGYIADTCITFETEPVDAAEMATRIASVASANLPWLVATTDATTPGEPTLLGYAYATPWRVRAAYRHSVETTIYLAPSAIGHGLGRRLYAALLDALRALPVHRAIGGIALPNAASIALHEALGFRPVARFTEVGRKQGRWIDVGYWELALPYDTGLDGDADARTRD